MEKEPWPIISWEFGTMSTIVFKYWQNNKKCCWLLKIHSLVSRTKSQSLIKATFGDTVRPNFFSYNLFHSLHLFKRRRPFSLGQSFELNPVHLEYARARAKLADKVNEFHASLGWRRHGQQQQKQWPDKNIFVSLLLFEPLFWTFQVWFCGSPTPFDS